MVTCSMNCFLEASPPVESPYSHDDTTELAFGQITPTADFHPRQSCIPHSVANGIGTRVLDSTYASSPTALLLPSVSQSRLDTVFSRLKLILGFLGAECHTKSWPSRQWMEASSEDEHHKVPKTMLRGSLSPAY